MKTVIRKGPDDNESASVQVMAWHRLGNKPLRELLATNISYISSLGQNEIK